MYLQQPMFFSPASSIWIFRFHTFYCSHASSIRTVCSHRLFCARTSSICIFSYGWFLCSQASSNCMLCFQWVFCSQTSSICIFLYPIFLFSCKFCLLVQLPQFFFYFSGKFCLHFFATSVFTVRMHALSAYTAITGFTVLIQDITAFSDTTSCSVFWANPP